MAQRALACSCGILWCGVGADERELARREVEFLVIHELRGHVTRRVAPAAVAPAPFDVAHAQGGTLRW